MRWIPILLTILCWVLGYRTGDNDLYLAGHIYLAAHFVISTRRPA